MDLTNNLVLVGVIASAHGIKGDIVVKSFTEPADNICKLSLTAEQKGDVELRCIAVKPNGRLVCRLRDVKTRTDAEKLRGVKLFTLRANLPEPQEDEFYVEDLKGLSVVNASLEHIGIVNAVFNFGASDIIEVRFDDAKVELFPFTKKSFPIVTKSYMVLAT